MSQQAPKLVSDTHYCVVGDVSVHATAAIAPGVVLQAASGSRIVVEQGVCLAAGVCIQSRSGVLVIARSTSLGANVLVIGSGTIGSESCISAGSTLINPAISAGTIVPPDSLVGHLGSDKASSAQANGFQNNGFQNNGFQNNGFQSNGAQNSFQNGSPAPSAQSYSTFQTGSSSLSNGVQSSQAPPSQTPSQITVRSSYDRVYGREQVSKLISALFPNRQPPNG